MIAATKRFMKGLLLRDVLVSKEALSNGGLAT